MFLADLHIHSHYARATSRQLVPEMLALWGRRKGLGVIGTGDFTHPGWRTELADALIEAEPGLYRLRPELAMPDDWHVPHITEPRFVLSCEISSIYKKHGKVRKVHNVLLMPSLSQAEAFSKRLERIGNLHSDGRPILGLDSRDLLEIALECCPEVVFIPAHIWTPHFSLFGAYSGFDTIEECFEDLTPHIHALETGLSSDPAMNWRLSALDGYTLVSNSDAHSPTTWPVRQISLTAASLMRICVRRWPILIRQGSAVRWNFSRKRANTIWMAIAYAKYAYRRRKPTSLAAYAPSAGRRLPSACCIALMNWRIARKEAARKPPGIMKA